MHDRVSPEVEVAWDSFHQVVNMTSEELRVWLLAEAPDEDQPGHELGLPELGLKVVDLLHKRKVDLTDQDADVMEQVVDFVLEQEAGQPPAGPRGDEWRRALMTVGHDPLRS